MSASGELHVYGQFSHHDEVVLVGTRAALLALHDALHRLLANPSVPRGTETIEAFVADGEGFAVQVRLILPEDIDNYVLPYAQQYRTEEAPYTGAVYPSWPRKREECP